MWFENYLKDDLIPTVFADLLTASRDLTTTDLDAICTFVLRAYSVKTTTSDVEAGRLEILSRKTPETLRLLPPSRPALTEHVKRALYVARWLWSRSHIDKPDYPNPENWGWRNDGTRLTPVWTTYRAVRFQCVQNQLFRKCTCTARCPVTNKIRCNNCQCSRNNINCYGHCDNCNGDCCTCPDC